MPDYKETTVTGVAWQRCHTVTAHNPLDGQPRVEFQEEKIVVLDGEPIRQWAPGCSVDFAPDAAVPLLDPATNTPTGESITHARIYQALYSLYMQTATDRDAAQE